MKTYRNYVDLPKNAIYLGSENGDGSMYEDLADALDYAVAPIKLIEDGIAHYFNLED
jgi:hypothetical protein